MTATAWRSSSRRSRPGWLRIAAWALRDQLDRASVSIVLNLAEGAGRRSAPDKAHFFTIARGSATECAAPLDLLLARGLILASDHRHARGLLVRVVQMLTRLAARVSATLEIAG